MDAAADLKLRESVLRELLLDRRIHDYLLDIYKPDPVNKPDESEDSEPRRYLLTLLDSDSVKYIHRLFKTERRLVMSWDLLCEVAHYHIILWLRLGVWLRRRSRELGTSQNELGLKMRKVVICTMDRFLVNEVGVDPHELEIDMMMDPEIFGIKDMTEDSEGEEWKTE